MAVEQPEFDIQAAADAIMEAKPEEVTILGKKRWIGWLHNSCTRKLSHIMITEKDPWKRNVKACSCVLLNGRTGLRTWFRLKFWYHVYWRWLYYWQDIDQAEIVAVLDASKKKIQSMPLAVATIYLTEMMDTMMMMARHEAGQAGQGGERPTP